MIRPFLIVATIALSLGGCEKPRPTETTLVYRFNNEVSDDNVVQIVKQISERLNTAGLSDVEIEPVHDRRLTVRFRTNEAETIESVKKVVSQPESFELRILADSSQLNHVKTIELAEMVAEQLVEMDGKAVARWVPFLDPQIAHDSVVTRKSAKGVDEALVIYSASDLNNSHFKKVTPALDDTTGRPSLLFELTSAGAARMKELSSSHLPDPVSGQRYCLGIIFDGKLITAPSISWTISDRGQITGNFSQQDVQYMVDVFRSGTIPLPLTVESESQKELTTLSK